MKIKFCGLTRPEDIQFANELKPDFIGFVFAEKSKRFVTPEKAKFLKSKLNPEIPAVGVFVNENPEVVAKISNAGIIDLIQLHGTEDKIYISKLRDLTDKKIIQAFKIQSPDDLKDAEKSFADMILLDSGAGTGKIFDWRILKNFDRPYFLAGGLNSENVSDAIKILNPYAVDVSSGIETGGIKNFEKMKNFVRKVRS